MSKRSGEEQSKAAKVSEYYALADRVLERQAKYRSSLDDAKARIDSLAAALSAKETELAAALERKGLEVVVVDPRGESRDQAKQVTQLREFFDVSFDQRHPELAARASAFVGLHPDQATNAIVSVGARLRKHWAVVPCCVFAEEYPRATKKGGPVTTTSDLGAWLLAGEGGGKLNRTVKLEFAGKDRVIFSSADLQTDVGY